MQIESKLWWCDCFSELLIEACSTRERQLVNPSPSIRFDDECSGVAYITSCVGL